MKFHYYRLCDYILKKNQVKFTNKYTFFIVVTQNFSFKSILLKNLIILMRLKDNQI